MLTSNAGNNGSFYAPDLYINNSLLLNSS